MTSTTLTATLLPCDPWPVPVILQVAIASDPLCIQFQKPNPLRC
jgi:hypothetical protein